MGIWKNAAFISASVLTATALLANSAAAASGFTDIQQSEAKDQIEVLHEKGIVNGVSDSLFDPQGELDAAQGVSLIVRALQLSLAAIDFNAAPEANGLFAKVGNDAWYAESFINAYYNGVELPADIDPGQALTREQFLHYLVQGIESTGQYPLIKMYINIADEASMEPEYQGTIQRGLLYKIASLDDNGNFNPKGIITREEAAVWLYNAVEFVNDHSDAASMSGDDSGEGL